MRSAHEKFQPFEVDGKAVTAEIEEDIGSIPVERLPAIHVTPPAVQPDSTVAISLTTWGCLGGCPIYTITVGTNGIVFEGQRFVVAPGRHTADVNPDEVRALAKRFVAADVYSMDEKYPGQTYDEASYGLSITIDGHTKKVTDSVGRWDGMPAVITELEHAVHSLARTDRWIEGKDGLVEALRAEKSGLHSFEAQVALKEAASRGNAGLVAELLKAGVPLDPLPLPREKQPWETSWPAVAGWLSAGSSSLEVLRVFIDAKVSEHDQGDKDRALAGAARSRNLDAAKILIAYGANPSTAIARWDALIQAAQGGNPDMVREFLRYHANLEKRDSRGRTAVFSAVDEGDENKDGADAVDCLRLLVHAGATVNARDNEGNTALHTAWYSETREELLKLGADVNARNSFGETPIFTVYDDYAIPLLLEHGADLAIRNKQGETVLEASRRMGAARQEALRKAMESLKKN